jgi:uncharacterized protein YbjT (DUF2867 family)
MNARVVTVLGGTGFLGRRVVRHLCERDFIVRIASRHLERGHRSFSSGVVKASGDGTGPFDATAPLCAGQLSALGLFTGVQY